MKERLGVQYEDIDRVEETVETGGNALPVTMIFRKGVCHYIDCGTEVLADIAAFCDYGREGVSRSYTRHRAKAASLEERERNRAAIRQAIVMAMQRQGRW